MRRRCGWSLPIILACDVIDAANDKQQAEPMAQAILATLAQAGLERTKDASGTLQTIPATLDNGYYSEAAVQALETLGFDPYIATTRQRHHAPPTDVPETPATGRSAWPRKCGRREGGRCMPGVRLLWSRCWPDQGSARFPPIFTPGLGAHAWRMAAGLPDA